MQMKDKEQVPESIKMIADRLTANPDNTLVELKVRLTTSEGIAVKVAAAVDDKSVNQWIKDVIQQSINKRAEILTPIEHMKAKIAIIKGFDNDQAKAKDRGFEFER